MKQGRYLKIEAGDWEYLSGHTNYTWPLQVETFVSVKFHSDGEIQLYLLNSQSEKIHPLGIFDKFERELFAKGFDTLTIKATAKTKIAAQVTATTRADLDPLDYEPVIIDAPIRDTEKLMMQQILETKLRSMGIDPDKLVASDPDDDEDLEFFDENPDLPPTPFEQFELDENAQLEADLSAIDAQSPDVPLTSSSPAKAEPSLEEKPDKDSTEESPPK